MAEDSVEPLITECPGCHTRFRVTEAQLAKANGRVRCGACRHVFRAADHLVLSLDADRPEVDPDTALDALLNELSEATAAREARTPEPAPVPRVVRERARGERPPPMPISPTPGVRPPVPHVTIMRGVPRTPPPPPQSIAPDPAIWKSPVANEPVEVRAPVDDPVVPVPDVGMTPETPEVDVAVETGITAPEPLPVPMSAEAPVVEPEAESPEEVEEIELAEHSTQPPPSAGRVQNRRETARFPVDPLGLGDPPFTIDVPAPRWNPWWLRAGIPIAFVVLTGQVLWFQFGTWSRDPQIRPLYEWLCVPLGCELPVMRAVDQFRTKNLVVRSHPEKVGALQVDAIIVNDAPFAQPFPRIELRFSAIGGNLVAARRFEPKEYLAGEAKGSVEIGARTPVHIALEIPDPGADAVNYIIAFQ